MIIVTKTSAFTGKFHVMTLNVSKQKWDKWNQGGADLPLVQDYFPELSPIEREFILTGVTQQEWDEEIGEEGEE